MKQIKFFVFAASLAVLSFACTKEAPAPLENKVTDHNNNAPGLVTFTATLDNAGVVPATHTQLVDGNKVEWIAGDAISIFDGATNKEVTTSDSGASASFSVDLTEAGPWYALYPYVSTASIADSKITTVVPSSQTAVNGSFADDLNVSVAQSNAGALAFKNALGLIKFTVGKDNISKVVLRGNNAEVLAGTVKFDYNSGDPTWEATSGIRFIELAPAAGTFTNGGTYFFAVLPQDFSAGFSLNFIDNTGLSFIVSTSNDANLHRSEILNISTADGKITLDDNIVFADADVKADIVAAFDTNGDGELSYREAAVVTYDQLKAFAWTNASTVNSFDELQFFTGLTSSYNGGKDIRVPALFTDCENLTSVKLPANVNTIDANAFQNCTSLTSIELPALRAIFASTFAGSGLTSIVIPNSVVSMSSSVFDGCSSLASVTLSENCPTIPNNAFRNTGLTYIMIPDAVTTINQNAFYGCASLVTVDMSTTPGLTTIGNYAFKNCTAMTAFRSPGDNVIASVGTEAFYGDNKMALRSQNLTHLSSIGESAFYNCAKIKANLVLTSPSLTTIPNYAFYGCSAIEKINLSPNITSIGEYAFFNCSKMSSFSADGLNAGYFKLPSGVTSIPQYAFSNCRALTVIEDSFPEGLTTIGDRAFRYCIGFVNVYLPSTLSSISVRAFESNATYQIAMGKLYVKATTPPTVAGSNSYGIFQATDDSNLPTIYVPAAKVSDYQAATGWSKYSAKIEGF